MSYNLQVEGRVSLSYPDDQVIFISEGDNASGYRGTVKEMYTDVGFAVQAIEATRISNTITLTICRIGLKEIEYPELAVLMSELVDGITKMSDQVRGKDEVASKLAEAVKAEMGAWLNTAEPISQKTALVLVLILEQMKDLVVKYTVSAMHALTSPPNQDLLDQIKACSARMDVKLRGSHV